MKVVILAGGLGTRLAEETDVRPKPMAEIGDRPVLWHIMKIYATHGYTDFVVCLGYKGHVIKEYFADYFVRSCDVTFDMCSGSMRVHQSAAEPWTVTLVDTGDETKTGGRLKRIREYVEGERFFCTYGDGVGDVDIARLVRHHEQEGLLATVTAVQPAGRFGLIEFGPDGKLVVAFREKPQADAPWVNGGFFVLEPSVLDVIDGDATAFEIEPMNRLAEMGQLTAYRHSGFWQPMDTLRDKRYLEDLWTRGVAPWKTWE